MVYKWFFHEYPKWMSFSLMSLCSIVFRTIMQVLRSGTFWMSWLCNETKRYRYLWGHKTITLHGTFVFNFFFVCIISFFVFPLPIFFYFSVYDLVFVSKSDFLLSFYIFPFLKSNYNAFWWKTNGYLPKYTQVLYSLEKRKSISFYILDSILSQEKYRFFHPSLKGAYLPT